MASRRTGIRHTYSIGPGHTPVDWWEGDPRCRLVRKDEIEYLSLDQVECLIELLQAVAADMSANAPGR